MSVRDLDLLSDEEVMQLASPSGLVLETRKPGEIPPDVTLPVIEGLTLQHSE